MAAAYSGWSFCGAGTGCGRYREAASCGCREECGADRECYALLYLPYGDGSCGSDPQTGR